MKSPLVSILIPSYNHEEYIQEAIESSLNQTYNNIEILIIDDGSSDNSPAIISGYAERYPDKIRYSRQENSGVATTLNKLIDMARGEYLSLMASDDILYPTKIEKQMSLFNADESGELGFVYSFADQINQNENRFRKEELTFGLRGFIFKELFELGVFFSPVSNLIKKSAVIECGKFKIGNPYCDDYELYLEIALKYKMDYVPEKLVARRIHYTNTSSNQHLSVLGNKSMLIAFAERHDLVRRYGIDVDKRLAKLDLQLAKHYFVSEDYSKSRKLLLTVLSSYPRVFIGRKSSVVYLVISFAPRVVKVFLKRVLGNQKFYLAS